MSNGGFLILDGDGGRISCVCLCVCECLCVCVDAGKLCRDLQNINVAIPIYMFNKLIVMLIKIVKKMY